MKLTLTTMVVICAAVVLFGGVLACNPSPTDPKPAPTPLPVEPVEDVNKFYQDEKATNETRLKERINRKERRAFYGTIDRIDGTKVQFLHTEKPLRKDRYLECKFKDEQQVWMLSAGKEASVAGRLADVNGGVRFDNCTHIQRR